MPLHTISKDMYLYVLCNKYMTNSYFNYIDILLIDNNHIYDKYKNKITNYMDYHIGIILDKDQFIPISTSLILYPSNNNMYTIPIYKKNNNCPNNKKGYFRIKKLNLSQDDNTIEPILVKTRVDKIQHPTNINSMGFVDLVMGDSYTIS